MDQKPPECNPKALRFEQKLEPRLTLYAFSVRVWVCCSQNQLVGMHVWVVKPEGCVHHQGHVQISIGHRCSAVKRS